MAQETASSSVESAANGVDTQTRVNFIYAYFSRLKEYGNGVLKDRKPWTELLDRTSFSRPPNTSEVLNDSFIVPYLCVILCMVMNPGALLVVFTLFAVWIYLFILKTSPLTIAGRQIGDREKLIGMTIISFVTVFFLTNVGTVMFTAILLGCCIIGLHGMMRVPDDLFIDGGSGQSSQSIWSILKGEQTGALPTSTMV